MNNKQQLSRKKKRKSNLEQAEKNSKKKNIPGELPFPASQIQIYEA